MIDNLVPKKSNPFLEAAWDYVSATIGVEASNIITISCQFQTARRRDVAVRVSGRFYLSDDANGDSIVATGVDTLAAGTDGLYTALVAGKAGFFTTEADGDLDLALTFASGAKTLYVVFVKPDGALQVVGPVTFA